MSGHKERLIEELYRDDPERADALAFARETDASRRGFLGGAGLAAMSAAVGGAIPFAANMPGGLIGRALEFLPAPSDTLGLVRRRPSPRRPADLKFRQERQTGAARR